MHASTHTHTHTHARTHSRTNTHTRTHTHTHARTHTYTHARTHTKTHSHTHAHTHTHTHTHKHTHHWQKRGGGKKSLFHFKLRFWICRNCPLRCTAMYGVKSGRRIWIYDLPNTPSLLELETKEEKVIPSFKSVKQWWRSINLRSSESLESLYRFGWHSKQRSVCRMNFSFVLPWALRHGNYRRFLLCLCVQAY